MVCQQYRAVDCPSGYLSRCDALCSVIRKQVCGDLALKEPPPSTSSTSSNTKRLQMAGNSGAKWCYGGKGSARFSRYKSECDRFFGHSCLSFQTSYKSSVLGYFEAIMPAAEAETNCATPVIEKDVEKFPERTKANSKEDEAVCKEVMTAEEYTKKTEESEKMEKENFPEKDRKDVSDTMPANEEKTECEGEGPAENAQGESTKMTENSKRRSSETEGDEGSGTKEEESPPKKRKST